MAKGQQRSNREIRKPKKKKEPVTAAAPSLKGALAAVGTSKKKN